MKKLLCAALIALCAAALAAQQVTDTSAVSLLNVGNYSKLFLNANGLTSLKYTRVASDDDHNKIAALGNDNEVIDSPLEIALLSTCAGVVDVRPVEASTMLGNARQADLKLGAAVYQEMQILRFLGNTDAVGRHEGILKFITDRGNVSGAEIQQYLVDGIKNIVDTEYNTRSFELRTGNKSYDVLLLRNSNNNSYTIRYDRASLENDEEEFTKPNLDALLDELKKRGFTSDNCATVRRESGLFPAVQRISGVTDNDTIALIKYLLADFYTTNNQTTILNDYKALLALYNRYDSLYMANKSDAGQSALSAMWGTIVALGPEFSETFKRDANTIIAASQRLSQQAKASLMSKLMSNNIVILAGTVGEIRR